LYVPLLGNVIIIGGNFSHSLRFLVVAYLNVSNPRAGSLPLIVIKESECGGQARTVGVHFFSNLFVLQQNVTEGSEITSLRDTLVDEVSDRCTVERQLKDEKKSSQALSSEFGTNERLIHLKHMWV